MGTLRQAKIFLTGSCLPCNTSASGSSRLRLNQAAPRSGVGLNKLLGANRDALLHKD